MLPVVLAVLLMVASAQNAFAAVIDQKQENISGGFQSIMPSDPMGQTFQPSMTKLEAVEAYIKTDPAGGDVIFLTIREGSVTGTQLLMASQSVASNFEGWVHFTFGSLTVTPGSTYCIRLTAASPFPSWGRSATNLYPNGEAIVFGNPAVPAGDFAFRTYGSGQTTTTMTRAAVGGVTLPANSLTVLAPYLTMIGLVATVAVAVRKRRN